MKGSKPSTIPGLQINNSYISNRADISNSLASYFHSKSVTSVSSLASPFFASLPTSQHHYNAPFSSLELNLALGQSKRTAPGPDSIHTQMIQNLPQSALRSLLDYFNHLWLNSCFPSLWLESIVIPVHKSGKPRSLPSSYRPISLTSQLCKLLERMVLHRLTWVLEKNNHLSPFQYGFRKYRSSMEHLASLDSDIRTALHHHHHLGLLSLDLSNAFDITNKHVILSQLCEMGIEGPLLKFIHGFLSPRTIRVKVNGHLSDPYTLSLGVPQGSVLSPTLFNIAMLSLIRSIPPQINYKLFADDLILYYSSSSSQAITLKLQNALNSSLNWANTHGYSFSPNKSAFLHFCKTRNCPRINPLNIHGTSIPSPPCHSILGLTFDIRMNWNAHFNSLRTRTAQDLKLLRLLAHTKWGSDFSSIIILYKSLILSKLNYGDFIYDSACYTSKRKLDAIQNQALRLATGAFRTSPISSLQCVSSIPPLYLNRQLSLMKFYTHSLNRPHLKSSLNISHLHTRSIPPTPNSIPFRIKQLLNLHNFTPPRFDYPLYTSFPPWQSHRPHIDFSMNSFDREITSNSIIKAIFFDKLKNLYPNYVPIYTDGSKSSVGVGAAFVTQNCQKTFKLPIYSSIFSAELLAIKESIRFAISSHPNSKFLIVSDSQSALLALHHIKLENAFIRQIKDLFFVARQRHKSFHFIWIPGHSNIKGNDRADSLAKEACRSGPLVLGENHPRDYIKYLTNEFRNLFQLHWELEDSNNKLWELKTEVYPPLHYHNMNRKENTTVRRLAIGHTYQTHSHLLNNEIPPTCPSCQSPLSVKHIFEAQHWAELRGKHHIPSNLKTVILTYKTISKHISDFLNDINFQV